MISERDRLAWRQLARDLAALPRHLGRLRLVVQLRPCGGDAFGMVATVDCYGCTDERVWAEFGAAVTPDAAAWAVAEWIEQREAEHMAAALCVGSGRVGCATKGGE